MNLSIVFHQYSLQIVVVSVTRLYNESSGVSDAQFELTLQRKIFCSHFNTLFQKSDFFFLFFWVNLEGTKVMEINLCPVNK